MKFHLLSDLHLEYRPYKLAAVPGSDKDYLLLAGDIGNPYSREYADLLGDASRSFGHVVVVKGNHECHHGPPRVIDERIRALCEKHDNVTYLQQETSDVGNDEDVRVVGATLWSRIEPSQEREARTRIGDFHRIPNWSVAFHNNAHARDVGFVREEIARAVADRKRLVVVTHHAPSTKDTSRPEHQGSPISSAFGTDLTDLFERPPVSAWAFGHTHRTCDFTTNGTRIVANQRGYPGEETGFDPCFAFEV